MPAQEPVKALKDVLQSELLPWLGHGEVCGYEVHPDLVGGVHEAQTASMTSSPKCPQKAHSAGAFWGRRASAAVSAWRCSCRSQKLMAALVDEVGARAWTGALASGFPRLGRGLVPASPR